ncbi:PKD domain-containing protein [Deinococcus lacus]|uniref:PKD domain-containing protein n=1 Tax=Deinococcus lacus TaxID=392561 RepID=A0ABW1YEI0_9DEIO
MPKTVNPNPAWTDTLDVPVPHETMDADDVAVPDTRLLANDKWLRKEFGARLDALERAVWPTSLNVGLTATETDAARHVWRFDYALSTNRGTVTAARLNFGDGSQEVTLSNPGAPGSLTHDYPDTGGTYTATLTATTSEGVTQAAQRRVTVAAPVGTVTASLNVELVSGMTYRFTPTYSTSAGQVTGATLNFGDGSQAVGVSGPVTHSYPEAAESKTYTATLTVTQSSGPAKSVTQMVTVQAAATDPGGSPDPAPTPTPISMTSVTPYSLVGGQSTSGNGSGYKPIPGNRLSNLHGMTDADPEDPRYGIVHGWQAGAGQGLPAALRMTYEVESDPDSGSKYYSWETWVLGFEVQNPPATGQVNLLLDIGADAYEPAQQLFVEYGGSGAPFDSASGKMLWTDSEVLAFGGTAENLAGTTVIAQLDAARLATGGGKVLLSLSRAGQVSRIRLEPA